MELLIGRSLDYETKLHPYIDEGNGDLSNREENKMIDLSSDLSSSDDSDLLNSDQVDSKLETILICVGDFLEFSKMTHNGEIPEDHLALSNEIRAQANKVQADLEKAQQDQANQEFSCFLQEADEILTSLKNNSFYKEFETNRALLLEDPNESENDKQSTLSIIQEVKQKLLLLSNKYMELQVEKDKAEEEHQKEVSLLKCRLKEEQDKYKDLKKTYDQLCSEESQISEDLDETIPKEETKEDTNDEYTKDKIVINLQQENKVEDPKEDDQQQNWRLNESSQEAMQSNQHLNQEHHHIFSKSNFGDQKESLALETSVSRDTPILEKIQLEEEKYPEVFGKEEANLEEENKAEQVSQEDLLIYKEVTYSDGSSYKGQVKAATEERHGQGTYLWEDGRKYIGQWKNGLREGYGTWYYKSGDIYEGEWVNEMFHGNGLYTWKDGTTYKGKWRNDWINGKGLYIQLDGYSYEGEYKDNMKHGQGVELYTNGNRYVGQFQNGLKHGEGVYTWMDGRTHEGHWEYDKKNGSGVYIDPGRKRRYEGKWKDDKLHGEATLVSNSGERISEHYDNDKMMPVLRF